MVTTWYKSYTTNFTNQSVAGTGTLFEIEMSGQYQYLTQTLIFDTLTIFYKPHKFQDFELAHKNKLVSSLQNCTQVHSHPAKQTWINRRLYETKLVIPKLWLTWNLDWPMDQTLNSTMKNYNNQKIKQNHSRCHMIFLLLNVVCMILFSSSLHLIKSVAWGWLLTWRQTSGCHSDEVRSVSSRVK